VLSPDAKVANPLIYLCYVGAVVLAAGLVTRLTVPTCLRFAGRFGGDARLDKAQRFCSNERTRK
jgi:hypothetical protein